MQININKDSLFPLRSRGIGADTGQCFVCEKEGILNNIAAFVDSKGVGEVIVQMFKKGASLDFRENEPDWTQIKIYACDDHRSNLETLDRLISDNTISLDKIAQARW